MLTELQAGTAKSIVNLFETGRVLGDYAQVTLIPGDTGGLTYGRSQTTLTSGGLHRLVSDYCALPEAQMASPLVPFLPALEGKDPALNEDRYFHNLLRAAADDAAMRAAQDEFFDREYWLPAARIATRRGITTPLGIAVVYDSRVHGAWDFIRRRTDAAAGPIAALGERAWITAYVRERRNWLANHRRADLRRTTYRMDTFLMLIEDDLWALELPLVVRGQEIDEAALAARPAGVFDGPPPRSRPIALARPLMRGLDVRMVQLALSKPDNGFAVGADGFYGRHSARAVAAFRRRNGMDEDHVVDEVVFDRLLQ